MFDIFYRGIDLLCIRYARSCGGGILKISHLIAVFDAVRTGKFYSANYLSFLWIYFCVIGNGFGYDDFRDDLLTWISEFRMCFLYRGEGRVANVKLDKVFCAALVCVVFCCRLGPIFCVSLGYSIFETVFNFCTMMI